jgi:hypothetical protein
MDGERLERIEELYHAARERDPSERADFLREACGDDEELRADVEGLLVQDAMNGPLERPAWATTTVQGASEFLLPAEGATAMGGIGCWRKSPKVGWVRFGWQNRWSRYAGA